MPQLVGAPYPAEARPAYPSESWTLAASVQEVASVSVGEGTVNVKSAEGTQYVSTITWRRGVAELPLPLTAGRI